MSVACEIVGKVPAHAKQDHRLVEMTALEHDELPRKPKRLHALAVIIEEFATEPVCRPSFTATSREAFRTGGICLDKNGIGLYSMASAAAQKPDESNKGGDDTWFAGPALYVETVILKLILNSAVLGALSWRQQSQHRLLGAYCRAMLGPGNMLGCVDEITRVEL